MKNLIDNNKVVKQINREIKNISPNEKIVLLCTNGFQTTDTHDIQPLKEYYEQNFQYEYPNLLLETVSLFTPSDKKTHKAKLYEKNISKAIEKYVSQGYKIILLGYSFSCSLIAKMAYKYKDSVIRVVFVAPIYDTILNNMIPGYIKYALKFRKLSKKYGNKISKTIGRQTVNGLIKLLLSILNSILLNRKYFKKVNQDCLLIRGDEDEMCTVHSLNKVSKNLKGNYNYYLYHKMGHAIVKSVRFNGIVFDDILNFTFSTPFLIEKDEQIIKNEVKEEKPILDEDGLISPSLAEIFTSVDPDCENEDVARENEF